MFVGFSYSRVIVHRDWVSASETVNQYLYIQIFNLIMLRSITTATHFKKNQYGDQIAKKL